MRPRSIAFLVVLFVVGAPAASCDLFANEGFPCASDGSCPGGLFCVDDICTSDAPPRGRRGEEGEGEEGEGEEGEGEEGEGEEGEGEEGEGEGDTGSGFVFTQTVLDLPAKNLYFATASGGDVVMAGWSSDAILGRPALSGQERIFVAGASPGGTFTLRGEAVVEANRTHLDFLEPGDVAGDVIVSGFVSGFVTSDVNLGSCRLSSANRLAVYSARVSRGGGCEVVGRVTASSSAAANVMKVLPYNRSGNSIIFGVQLSTGEGTAFDLEIPAVVPLGLTDWGTAWVAGVPGSLTTSVSESFFLGAANAATLTVAGTSDFLAGEPVTFRGVQQSATQPTAVIGSANSLGVSFLRESQGTEAAKLADIDGNAILVGEVLGTVPAEPCPGLLVTRFIGGLQDTVWTARLCTSPLVAINSVVVVDNEVIVLFFAGGAVSLFEGGQILVGSGGLIAAAFDADTGSLLALANAFVEGIGTTAPAEPAVAAAGSVCGDNACAISVHRR